MSPETAFQIASALVLPQWLLMAFAPRWSVTRWLMNSYLIPVSLGVMYSIYLFGGGPVDFAAFGTLSGVKGLFSQGGDSVILAAWVHYLAFDLVVGSLIVRDAQEKHIPHWLIVLPLLFCFMLGPVGLFLYWVVRLIRTRRLSI